MNSYDNPYESSLRQIEYDNPQTTGYVDIAVLLLAAFIIIFFTPIASFVPKRGVPLWVHFIESCCWTSLYIFITVTIWNCFLL